MRRFIFSLILLALLSACSTSVPIRDVPVYDKVGVSVDTKSALANSSVAPVNTIDTKSLPTMDLGPAGTGRVVYFDLDSYAIKSEYQSLIEANAKFLRANPARKVSIEGHTDERGGREYNLALGQKRADAVRKAFSLLGIPEAQLESISYGKEKPAAHGSDETAYSQNRRAEITYR
jgi:peptidoglycan-associated lipoprotein